MSGRTQVYLTEEQRTRLNDRALQETLDAFVAYDERLLSAAVALGMPVVSPGGQ